MATYGLHIIMGIFLSLPAPLKMGLLMLNGLFLFSAFTVKQAAFEEEALEMELRMEDLQGGEGDGMRRDLRIHIAPLFSELK